MQDKATTIFCKTQSSSTIVENIIYHGRTKHKKIKYYFNRKAKNDKEVKLVYCCSEDIKK